MRFFLDDAGHLALYRIHVEQLAHTEHLLHEAVGVYGSDAASCRAELSVAEAVLLEAVEHLVIGHADNRAVAYLEVIGGNGDARIAELLDLAEKVLYVDDHAGSEHVDGVVAEDAGGKEVKYELSLLVNYGMTRIVSALIADYDVIIAAEQVNHSALALVAPVDSGD